MNDKAASRDWFDQVAYVADIRPSEVARLTGLSRQAVVDWLKWRWRAKPYRACWMDLVEFVVVAAWRHEWPERDWRTAIRYAKNNHAHLAEKRGTRYPYAAEGAFADKGCAFDSHALGAVAAFDYEFGLVRRWHPRGRDNPVVLDIMVGFGHPSIRGIYTSTLADRIKADGDVGYVARDYRLSRKEVLAALEFEGVIVQPGCKVETGEGG